MIRASIELFLYDSVCKEHNYGDRKIRFGETTVEGRMYLPWIRFFDGHSGWHRVITRNFNSFVIRVKGTENDFSRESDTDPLLD